jgi:hypothetical protein
MRSLRVRWRPSNTACAQTVKKKVDGELKIFERDLQEYLGERERRRRPIRCAACSTRARFPSPCPPQSCSHCATDGTASLSTSRVRLVAFTSAASRAIVSFRTCSGRAHRRTRSRLAATRKTAARGRAARRCLPPRLNRRRLSQTSLSLLVTSWCIPANRGTCLALTDKSIEDARSRESSAHCDR